MDVAVRELKAQLSKYLARARAGEVVEVRSHNKPIARITGIPPEADTPLQRLVASQALTWSGRKPVFAAPLKPGAGGTNIARMVIEDRG
ncbi:type II toxin-antitoxin system Phd/YefM family antitoxin [Methyloversatilis thermotolerans]|uniref:type II toxin-antitoxin system Phd/YefM family antitoxin n=1 Tax=Methyloversatilis thermotolerans TaxID=1346290 RepID=UPI00037DACF1|nr:type II toxin-antitoxin system prevent-host-death family antitoxin [Methyloversatilis thermotolerans]